MRRMSANPQLEGANGRQNQKENSLFSPKTLFETLDGWRTRTAEKGKTALCKSGRAKVQCTL
jgi:hypothetical protein